MTYLLQARLDADFTLFRFSVREYCLLAAVQVQARLAANILSR